MQHIDELYNDLVNQPVGDDLNPLDLGLDNIDDDGISVEQEQPISASYINPTEVDNDGGELDTLSTYLSSKGIDPSSIKIQNEEGNEEIIPFSSLSQQEQLELIESVSATEVEDNLESDEIELLNFLRENNFSLEDAVNFFKNQGIEEFVKQQQAESFNVDNFSDEEIYILDLKSKFEELTDDEVEIELEKQLENPELFKKKVDKIREELRQSNIEDIEYEKQSQAELNQQMLEELQENLISVANSIEDIGGLELDDDDKEEVLSLILDRDANNTSLLLKQLDDPETLFKVSWFILHGEEAFDTIHKYWKSEVEKLGPKQIQTRGQQTTKKSSIIPEVDNKNHFGKVGVVKTVDDLWAKP